MSDKKKSEQAKTANNTSDDSNNIEKQTGLSASINISSTQETPSDIDVAPENTDNSPKEAHDPVKKTSENSKSQTAPLNKNNDKGTVPVKNSTSTSSSKPTAAGSKNQQEKSTTPQTKKSKQKMSKMAVVALIIALLAISASAGHYYWNEQQKAQYSQQINEMVNRQLLENQQQIKQQQLLNMQHVDQLMLDNKKTSAAELNALRNQIEQQSSIEKNNSEIIAQLQQQIINLDKNQPSDWLLQEAEYLIRVASRSLWLEKDAGTAISLLNDADLRIEELNDPQFLTLRQIIQQDIAKLRLLPTLTTDNVILKLMTLDQQIKDMPLAILETPEISTEETTLELSDNTSDWRENLAKTWHNFTAKFFTVTRRSGNIEPLLSPQFQQNLRENLSLKLQTAIWAASKANSSIYLQVLNDTQQWLNDYFDMTTLINQNFIQTIDSLKTATIKADYPNNVAALKFIRQILSAKDKPATLIVEEETTSDAQQEPEPTSAEPSEDL
jgi:uroporphyrin-3 C-methyltransferase